MQYQDAEYNQFKLLTVADNVFPDSDSAINVMKWVSAQKYELFGRNRIHSAYDILRAFSRGGHFNGNTMPLPEFNWIPSGWYNAIEVSAIDHRWLPQPRRSVYCFLEEVDVLAEAQKVRPEWREPSSNEYLSIDVAKSESSRKIVPLVALSSKANPKAHINAGSSSSAESYTV